MSRVRFLLFVFSRWLYWAPRQWVSRQVNLWQIFNYHRDCAWIAEMHYEGGLSWTTRVWVLWKSFSLARADVRRLD